MLELSIAASRLGTTSFTIATDVRIAGDERVIVSLETVYVLVDGRTLTKLPLPEALRVALREGAAGRTTDHAAYFEPPPAPEPLPTGGRSAGVSASLPPVE